MVEIKELLRKSLNSGLITIPDWNKGLFVYIIYRIVWETKSNYLLYAVDTEEQAKKIVKEFNSPNEYFYQEIKVN